MQAEALLDKHLFRNVPCLHAGNAACARWNLL